MVKMQKKINGQNTKKIMFNGKNVKIQKKIDGRNAPMSKGKNAKM